MSHHRFWVVITLFVILVFSSNTESIAQMDSVLLENILCSDTSQIIQKVMSNPNLYRLQIIYSTVHLDKWNCLQIQHHTFRLREKEYFYPASLVKLPLALLVLEWLDKNRLTKELLLQTKASQICSGGNIKTYNDSTTIAQYIEKSLVFSDNRSFNELYELLGVNYINHTLQQKGYPSAKIFQRIDNCDYLTNLKNDTVILRNQKKDTVYFRSLEKSNTDYEVSDAIVGNKLFTNGKYLETGKSFKRSNQLSLMDLQKMLIGTFYPNALHQKNRFCLSDRDQKFLINALGKFPNELDSSRFHKNDSTPNMDFKYLLAGGSGNNFPPSVKIYNKVGLSYGFMEDVSFIIDTQQKTGFFLSCVLFANEDGIMNDGQYEYYTVGFPFMKKLGEIILNYHRNHPLFANPDTPTVYEPINK